MTGSGLRLAGVRRFESTEVQELSIVNGKLTADCDESSLTTVDLSGFYVAPGYIDLQINGGWGIDLQQSPERVWELGKRLVEVGVTSFCPTLTSDGTAHLEAALQASSERPADYNGAHVCGWHLEGPWLNPERNGAHSEHAIQSIGDGIANGSYMAGDLTKEGGVSIVTLAPELAGAMDAIATLAGADVVVSLGHSEASMPVARKAFEAGATMGTHLFNAMPGLHHRSLSLATALALEAPFVGLIADGVHVAPEMVKLAWRVAADRLLLVSDAVAAMGQPALDSTKEVARTFDGTIAGSLNGLDQCVRNLVSFTSATKSEAIAAATATPAQAIGLSDRGHLAEEGRADLIVLSNELEVVMTIVDGEIAYDRR